MATELKRNDRENFHALGGDIGFLFERLHGWVVGVHLVNGHKTDVVVKDAYNNDGQLVGYEHSEDEDAWGVFDRSDGGSVRKVEGVYLVGDVVPIKYGELRIPWTDIDAVEVY